MKRFLLFKCDRYYPSGGWGDFAGSFDSISDSMEFLADNPLNTKGEIHLVDSESGTMVFQEDKDTWD